MGSIVAVRVLGRVLCPEQLGHVEATTNAKRLDGSSIAQFLGDEFLWRGIVACAVRADCESCWDW